MIIESLESRRLCSVYAELAAYPGIQQHYQSLRMTPSNGYQFLSDVHHGILEITVNFHPPQRYRSNYPDISVRDHFYLMGSQWVFGSSVIAEA